ncbi:phosphoglycerate mutase [Fulvitalea axinellae]|uniref:Phosphoglycerate mutase n=1 Tax=Fulvitalea axinellae TaxID=1182444 RepID=A0AAU9CV40_9BACT|nr:phosphoglycerate mutase [Fulvitalea axinellae]
MESKKIYLVRHGQTDLNTKGVMQGSGVDADLNETGKKQAETFFERHKNVPFDKVYVSALKRTAQTVASFVENGVPMERLAGLNEISWGIIEGKVPSPEERQTHESTLKAWAGGDYERAMPEGESPLDVVKRQQEAMERIMENVEEKNVLVCLHGRALKILLTWLTGGSLSEMERFTHTNLSLYILEYVGGTFRILEHDQRV